jgi:hypothetical protein
MTAPNDKSSMDFGGSFAVQDPETMAILNKPVDLACLNDTTVIERFSEKYAFWVGTTKDNTVKGLSGFPYKCYSNGSTEAFDKFYLRNNSRRFRCFKGEYMYHKLAWRNTHQWKWLEDDDLKSNDAVIISLPFADTGDKHRDFYYVINRCCELGIPVLIDCIYFGVCQDIVFDLDYPCITDVVFGLSKTFPVAHARIGIRFTRVDDDDTMFMYQKIQYSNRIGAELGLRYLDRFNPDYIPNKYKDKQLEFCKTLNVNPTKTVMFGQGGAEWQQYNRGGYTNRLSFHKQFIQGLNYASSN